jgi:hypothetical protein
MHTAADVITCAAGSGRGLEPTGRVPAPRQKQVAGIRGDSAGVGPVSALAFAQMRVPKARSAACPLWTISAHDDDDVRTSAFADTSERESNVSRHARSSSKAAVSDARPARLLARDSGSGPRA